MALFALVVLVLGLGGGGLAVLRDAVTADDEQDFVILDHEDEPSSTTATPPVVRPQNTRKRSANKGPDNDDDLRTINPKKVVKDGRVDKWIQELCGTVKFVRVLTYGE